MVVGVGVVDADLGLDVDNSAAVLLFILVLLVLIHPYEESIVDDNVRNISNIIARRRRHCGCGCCRCCCCIMIFYLSSLLFVCVCSILSVFAFVFYEEMNDDSKVEYCRKIILVINVVWENKSINTSIVIFYSLTEALFGLSHFTGSLYSI